MTEYPASVGGVALEIVGQRLIGDLLATGQRRQCGVELETAFVGGEVELAARGQQTPGRPRSGAGDPAAGRGSPAIFLELEKLGGSSRMRP
ncbi:MAG: hypothetical protein AB2820_15410 [Candidatus Thiodiazotropha sp.]